MLGVLKRLGYFFKREKKSYIIMAIILTIISILGILPASILGSFIDLVTTKTLTKSAAIWLAIAMFIVSIGRYVCSWVLHMVSNMKGQQLTYELREQYLMQLFAMDINFFETYSKGELMSRMTTDLDMMRMAATKIITDIFVNSLHILVVTAAMMITVDVRLTVASALVIPFFIVYLNNKLFKMREYYQTHRTIYSAMTESILESVEGAEVIKAYVQEEEDTEKMHKAIDADIASWKYIVRFEAIFGPLFDFVIAIATVIAFGYGSYLVVTSQISVGQLVTFSMYLTMFTGPILGLSNVFNQFNQVIIAEERIQEIMQYVPEVQDVENKAILDFKTLEFKDVTFKYPFDLEEVIKGISFTVKKGQNIGIVGPSGAGKSTIIRHLLREFNVQGGEVLLNGQSIDKFKIEDVHNLIGYVPQAHMLFRGDVEDNILIGMEPRQYSNSAIERAVQIADFAKDLQFMPDGMNTKVGEFGSGLSGGQKQRLSIARALVTNPEILILDDSLSAVDASTEQTIIEKLDYFRKDKTNIIIAHRFSAIKDADFILVVEDGKISESGTHDELMELGGWYADQYLYQNTDVEVQS